MPISLQAGPVLLQPNSFGGGELPVSGGTAAEWEIDEGPPWPTRQRSDSLGSRSQWLRSALGHRSLDHHPVIVLTERLRVNLHRDPFNHKTKSRLPPEVTT